MHSLYRQHTVLWNALYILPRTLSSTAISSATSTSNKYWNTIGGLRFQDLGRDLYQSFLVNKLVDEKPNWSVAKINDFVKGFSRSPSCQVLIDAVNTVEDVKDPDGDAGKLFSKLGELHMHDEEDELNSLLNTIYNKCMSNMTESVEDEIIKRQHPFFIFETLCNEMNANGRLITDKLSDEEYEVSAYMGDELLATKSAAKLDSAMQLACLKAMEDKRFSTGLKRLKFDPMSAPREEDHNLDLKSSKERTITLTKLEGEPFGITILGGQEKVTRNKEYLQKHIISPIFISAIQPDSPAERCGLKVGNVLIAVNDFSLEENTHNQAVFTLNKFVKLSTMKFTVRNCPETLQIYKTEKVFLEREKDKLREELSHKHYGRWHDALAKSDPEQYLLEKLKDKKRPYVAKKYRKSMRLWDY